MQYKYYTYIMTNKSNSVLYVGVTNDLWRRVGEHKQNLVDGFTKRYNAHKLVYYEIFNDIKQAIKREKQIKGWLRARKNELISSLNPEWNELFE